MASHNINQTRSRVFKLTSLALGFLIALVIVEIVLRVAGWESNLFLFPTDTFRLSTNSKLKYELRPGALDWYEPVNSEGLRDRDFELEKAPDVFRIAVLGDSIAYGFPHRREYSFGKQLEELLRQVPSSKRFEVINFGVTGYNIDQVVEQARAKALPYEPDLLLYAYCLNDPQESSLELRGLELEQGLKRRLSSHVVEALRRLSSSRVVALLNQSLLQWSNPQEQLTGFPSESAEFIGSFSEYLNWLHREPRFRNRVSEGFSNLRKYAGLGSDNLLVLIVPTAEIEDREYSVSYSHDQILRLANDAGLPAFDLRAAFLAAGSQAGSPLFTDVLHPSQLGHQLMAMAILQELITDRWMPTSVGFESLDWATPSHADLARLLIEDEKRSATPD